MQNSAQFTSFIFFSKLESFNFCLSVRQMLDVVDDSMFCYLSSIRSCLNLIEAPEHKISLDNCISLSALLGAMVVFSKDGRSARASYESAIQILSKKISEN